MTERDRNIAEKTDRMGLGGESLVVRLSDRSVFHKLRRMVVVDSRVRRLQRCDVMLACKLSFDARKRGERRCALQDEARFALEKKLKLEICMHTEAYRL